MIATTSAIVMFNCFMIKLIIVQPHFSVLYQTFKNAKSQLKLDLGLVLHFRDRISVDFIFNHNALNP